MKKLALITGAAKRIGRVLALHFVKTGWHVAAHYNGAATEALALQEEGQGGITLFQADLSLPHAGEKLFAAVMAQCGMPQLLINNASRFLRDDHSADEAALHMAVNATAPMALCKAFYESGGRGHIINMLDATLDASKEFFDGYVESKRALTHYTHDKAPAFAPQISMCGLLLGPTIVNSRESDAHFNKVVASMPSQQPTSLPAIIHAIENYMKNPSRSALIDLS